MEWVLVKTFLSLAGVIALMIAVVWLLRRTMLTGNSGASAAVEIQIMGSRMLQPKQSVYVLRVLNKVLIVGAAADGLHTLGEITDEESLHAIEQRLNAQTTRKSWFAREASGTRVPFADVLRAQAGRMIWKGAK
jgi:flagellar biogenesis protein FliO